MSNTKHTPGPWMKTDGNAIKCDLRPIGLTVDAGMIVASVVGGPTSGYSFPQDASEVEANARLIAAAPDMLAAAQDALTLLNILASGYDEGHTAAGLRAAIAKATQRRSNREPMGGPSSADVREAATRPRYRTDNNEHE